MIFWYEVSEQQIIGPFSLKLGMLQEIIREACLSIFRFYDSRENFPTTVLMQDGASPYYDTQMQAILNWKKPNYWITRGGTVQWPIWSPELTPWDFFLGVHLKARIYATPFLFVADLKARISREVWRTPRDMLKRCGKIWNLDETSWLSSVVEI